MSIEDTTLACFTLDLEHDYRIPDENSNPTFRFIDDYISIIDSLDIPLSIFATGVVIENYSEIIEKFQQNLDVEFHLHSYQHDVSKSYKFSEEIKEGIYAYQSHFQHEPIGYRAPEGNITPRELAHLEKVGFKFDSSIFPSYRPGVYNNMRKPRYPYYPEVTENLLEIPFATVPWLRIPISQSYLKLFGIPYMTALKHIELPNLLVFDHHLQDFHRTTFHDHLPKVLKVLMTRNMDKSYEILRRFIDLLRKKGYKFGKISEIYKKMR